MPRRITLTAAPKVLRAGNGESRSEDARPSAGATTETNGGGVSGRVRHEEKITVYVSAEELLALGSKADVACPARYGCRSGTHRTRGDRCNTR